MPAKKPIQELKMTRKIVQGSRGDYTISIPKRLAAMRGLQAGQEAEWKITPDGKLELTL